MLTEEDYFVAPPGNIPLNLQKNKYREDSSKEEKHWLNLLPTGQDQHQGPHTASVQVLASVWKLSDWNLYNLFKKWLFYSEDLNTGHTIILSLSRINQYRTGIQMSIKLGTIGWPYTLSLIEYRTGIISPLCNHNLTYRPVEYAKGWKWSDSWMVPCKNGKLIMYVTEWRDNCH